MTNQQAFDHVVAHLLTQGQQAKGGYCAYLLQNDNGLRCALGSFLPRHTKGVRGGTENAFLTPGARYHRHAQKIGLTKVDRALLADLRRVHDFNIFEEDGAPVDIGLTPIDWPLLLLAVAAKYDLCPDIIWAEEFADDHLIP